jgi:hypothetical protein
MAFRFTCLEGIHTRGLVTEIRCEDEDGPSGAWPLWSLSEPEPLIPAISSHLSQLSTGTQMAMPQHSENRTSEGIASYGLSSMPLSFS